jgi:hypothetical protein
MHRFLSLAASAVLAFAAAAESKPPAAGHWEGSIQVPNHEMKIAVDLDLDDKGAWIGDLDIPEQGLSDFPLSGISFKENIVRFELAGIPGNPAFEGEISPDGTILAGDFSQGGSSVPAELKRISEPKVVLPANNTPVAKEFEGSWECSIPSPDGKTRRSVLKLANSADGPATGVLVADEGVQFPVSGIEQAGAALKFEIKPIGLVFAGERRGDEIPGGLRVAGKELPLTLKRAPAAAK